MAFAFDLLKVFFSSLISLASLFLITKLIGNKQISQLNLFDYINGITIGSIAAELATSLEGDVLKPLIALAIYGFGGLAISFISMKSIKMRGFFSGTSLILFENQKIYNENLKKARLDINEFLTQCRVNGYFDLSQLQSAIMETNGNISFLPLSKQRPLTPCDIGITPKKEYPLANVIIDGKVMLDCLKHTGNDEKWLTENLKKQGVSHISEVFLATCDSENTLNIYKKIDRQINKNIFE